MGLYAEQVRRLANEENLVSDTAEYTQEATSDWVTKVSKTITLDATKIVVVRFETLWKNTLGASYTLKGGGQVLLDTVPLRGTGYVETVVGAGTFYYKFCEVFLKLNPGNYTFNFQVSVVHGTIAGCYVLVKNINIGYIDFLDMDAANQDSGNVDVPASSEVTIITKTPTMPATRKIVVGGIKRVALIVLVNGLLDGDAKSVMKNPGESNETNRINWKIFINAEQQAWTERQNDYQTIQPTYCEGAYGRYCKEVYPSASPVIEIKAYNGFAATKTVRAYISIIYSPWILTDIGHEPFSLDFPQGTTLYVVLEPLTRNGTKRVLIGKKRSTTFGETTDYYASGSGVDIVSFSYTFEIVEVTGVNVVVDGFGGCIGIIGMDVR